MNKTLTTKSIELTLSNVEAELQLECQRVRDEIQAYKKFAKQLDSIPVIETPQVATSQPARFDSDLPVDRNRGIKELFESTVMAVPHFTEDYNESFLEHLATEFTPEVAISVKQSNHPNGISPQLQSVLYSQAKTAIETRKQLLSTIDSEEENITDSATKLIDRSKKIDKIHQAEISGLDFGGLEAYWKNLEQQKELVDNIAIERQKHIFTSRRSAGPTNTTSDLYEYLYQDLEEIYPILARIGEVGETIQREQKEIELRISCL